MYNGESINTEISFFIFAPLILLSPRDLKQISYLILRSAAVAGIFSLASEPAPPPGCTSRPVLVTVVAARKEAEPPCVTLSAPSATRRERTISLFSGGFPILPAAQSVCGGTPVAGRNRREASAMPPVVRFFLNGIPDIPSRKAGSGRQIQRGGMGLRVAKTLQCVGFPPLGSFIAVRGPV